MHYCEPQQEREVVCVDKSSANVSIPGGGSE